MGNKMEIHSVRDLFWSLMMTEHDPESEVKFKSPPWQVPVKEPKPNILALKLLDVCREHNKVLFYLNAVSAGSFSSHYLQIDGKTIRNGSYLSALTSGVYEIKQRFLIDCEVIKKNYVKNPHFVQNSDIYQLTRMSKFYSQINSIFQEIVDLDLAGCQILNLCLKYEYLTPEISEFMKRIVKCLESVLVTHIKLWILHGVLNDPYHEFFVAVHQKTPDEDLSFSNDLSISNASGFTVMSSFSEMGASMIASTCTKLPFNVEQIEDDSVYDIDASNVPTYLSYSLVAKILNVGNILILLKHAPSDDIVDPFAFVRIDNYGLNEKKLLKRILTLLEGQNFDSYLLEDIVNEIWLGLNKYLKTVACDVGGLRKQYEIITDLYMMGRGDLFKEFIKKAGYFLQCESSTVRSQSLRTTLEHAADDLYGSCDILERFAVTLPPKHHRPKGSKTIDVIKIDYKVLWPLHLIFTNEVIESYNLIFRFLLTLKSVYTEILQVHQNLNTSSKTKSQEPEIRLYHLLDNVLVNLQGYIFIDVIMSEKSKFEDVLNNSESFHDIQKAHAIFLSNVLSQMFLTNSKLQEDKGQKNFICNNEGLVQEEFRKLFSLSSNFCKCVSLLEPDDSFRGESFISMLERSEQLVRGILALVDTIHEKYSAEHLSRLVVRLDYNLYFSETMLVETESSLTSW